MAVMLGNQRPRASGRKKSSPEDGNRHQNPLKQVEITSSAPAFYSGLVQITEPACKLALVPASLLPMNYP